MSTITQQPPRAPMPSRQREPIGNRPLPKGIVAIAQSQPVSEQNQTDSAPEGTLIVGRDIQVKGQIEDCRVLIVEGQVKAALKAERIEIRQGGAFSGSAQVGTAIVAGAFEGTLNVSDLLEIRSKGRVEGETCYDQISIEAGGLILGTLERVDESKPAKPSQKLASAGS